MRQKRIISISILISVLQSVSGQFSLASYEREVLSPFFESSPKNKFARILEEDQNHKILREWIFNDNGKLYKELDYRESGLYSSINGESFGSVLSNYKEYFLKYDSDNQISKVLKTLVMNDDTLKTIVQYDRSIGVEVAKTSTLELKGSMEKDFTGTTYSSNGRKDSVLTVSFSRAGEMGFESRSKTLFVYGDRGKIKQELYYFHITEPLKEGEKKEQVVYQLAAITNYGYDMIGRLNEIEDLEVNGQGEEIFNSLVQYEYLGNSTQIGHIQIQYGESYNNEQVELVLRYDTEGNLLKIQSDLGVVHYRLEKRS